MMDDKILAPIMVAFTTAACLFTMMTPTAFMTSRRGGI